MAIFFVVATAAFCGGCNPEGSASGKSNKGDMPLAGEKPSADEVSRIRAQRMPPASVTGQQRPMGGAPYGAPTNR